MTTGIPINTDRTAKGYFAKGNQIGRMKRKGFTLNDLNKLIVEYEKTHDNTLLKHYIERLYKNDRLLENFIEKNVPTKTINEHTGKDGEPIELIKRVYTEKNENTNPT
jgi:hypothetical protein